MDALRLGCANRPLSLCIIVYTYTHAYEEIALASSGFRQLTSPAPRTRLAKTAGQKAALSARTLTRRLGLRRSARDALVACSLPGDAGKAGGVTSPGAYAPTVCQGTLDRQTLLRRNKMRLALSLLVVVAGGAVSAALDAASDLAPCRKNSALTPGGDCVEDSERNSEVAGRDPQVTGRDPQVTSRDPQVTGRDPQVTDRDPQVTGRDPQVTGRDPHVTGRDPQVTGRDPQVTGRSSGPLPGRGQLAPAQTEEQEIGRGAEQRGQRRRTRPGKRGNGRRRDGRRRKASRRRKLRRRQRVQKAPGPLTAPPQKKSARPRRPCPRGFIRVQPRGRCVKRHSAPARQGQRRSQSSQSRSQSSATRLHSGGSARSRQHCPEDHRQDSSGLCRPLGAGAARTPSGGGGRQPGPLRDRRQRCTGERVAWTGGRCVPLATLRACPGDAYRLRSGLCVRCWVSDQTAGSCAPGCVADQRRAKCVCCQPNGDDP